MSVCVSVVYTTGVLLPDDGERALGAVKIELRQLGTVNHTWFSGGLLTAEPPLMLLVYFLNVCFIFSNK